MYILIDEVIKIKRQKQDLTQLFTAYSHTVNLSAKNKLKCL